MRSWWAASVTAFMVRRGIRSGRGARRAQTNPRPRRTAIPRFPAQALRELRVRTGIRWRRNPLSRSGVASSRIRPCCAPFFLFVPSSCCWLALRAALPPSSSYNYDEAKVGSIPLPPVLTARDGTVIRTAAQWTALRRPELLELFTREMFGRNLVGRPPGLRWTVTSVDRDRPRRHRGAQGNHPRLRRRARRAATARAGLSPGGGGGRPAPVPRLCRAELLWQPVRPLRSRHHRIGCSGCATTPRSRWWTGGRPRARGACMPTAGRSSQVVARGYATATAYYGELCEDRPEGLSRGLAAWAGTGRDRGTGARRVGGDRHLGLGTQPHHGLSRDRPGH
jgi:hypothetical protein